MKKYVLFLTLIGIFYMTNQSIVGQISEGGKPVSFSLNMDKENEKIPVITMPSIDEKAILKEEENANLAETSRPFRFGKAIDVDINMKKDGLKIELPNGDKLWLLKIHSPNAVSINLIYDQFMLGKGSQFFLYNEDKSMVLGAYTPEVSNNPNNVFATELLKGNTIVLEYYEPKSSNDNSIIHINKVIHGFNNVYSSRGLDDSGTCNVDVNCTLGSNWLNEKRSVCLIIMGEFAGSGCLINNTQQDLTPYILTARHNYFDNNGYTTPDRNPATSVFIFKYWKPNCGSGTPSGSVSITGATIKANLYETDFALLLLNSMPPASYNLFYAGWDRSTIKAATSTAIHHPAGDVMKISYESHAVDSVTFINCGIRSNHWRVTHFEQGIVQPGSSGSPLFNSSKRIVGQLHGNQNNQCTGININNNVCHCNQTPIGEYGRFDLSWTGGGANNNRLSNWLDPIGLNPSYLNGIDCPQIPIRGELAEGNNTWQPLYTVNYIQDNNIIVKVNYPGATTFNWTKLSSDDVISWSIGTNGTMLYINMLNATTASFRASANGYCGTIQSDFYFIKQFKKSSWLTTYPNPTNDQLNIVINKEVYLESKTLENNNLLNSIAFDIRLYDIKGNLVRNTTSKGEKVELNMSNLPNGFYFLHIIDSKSNTTEMQQTIIKN